MVCKHGKKRSTELTKNGEWIGLAGLSEFSLVDANGAGDNFFSEFLYAFLKGDSVLNSMRYGSLCGAYCITSKQLVFEGLSMFFLEKEFTNHFSV